MHRERAEERERGRMVRFAIVGALATLLAHASGAASAQQASSGAPVAIAESGLKQSDSSRITGIVLEALNSRNNSYLRIDTGDEELWVATPRIAVSAGDTVSMSGGARVIDFYSTRLDRRFDALVFVGAVEVEGGEDAP
jgi:hypothetical protein